MAQERKTHPCPSHSFETIWDLAKTLSLQQSHRSEEKGDGNWTQNKRHVNIIP